MCKPEPLAWDSESCFTRLSRRLPQASSSWWRHLWRKRKERWQEILGDTLRVETCLPIATGNDLRAILADALANIGDIGVNLTDDCTAEMIDANKGPLTNGRKGTQKLTRYLAQLIYNRLVFTMHVPRVACVDCGNEYHDGYVRQQWYSSLGGVLDPRDLPTEAGEKQLRDRAAALVGSVFESVQSHNGLKLVLSANPIDILDSGHYANYGSCHAWHGSDAGCHAAGTFALSASPNVLVAYLYKQTAHEVGKVRGDATPWKEWRQLIYPTRNGIIFAREYGHELLDFRHAILRRLVAERIGGPGCDWQWKRTSKPGEINYTDDGPYAGDELTGILRIAGKHGDDFAIFDVGPTVCPSCGDDRESPKSEAIFCNSCGGEDETLTRRCDDCREYVQIDDEDDWDNWINIGDQSICPSCAESYSYCDGCCEYVPDDDMCEATDRRGHSVYRCSGCLDCGDYGRCVECNEHFHVDILTTDSDGDLWCNNCRDANPDRFADETEDDETETAEAL